MNVWVHFREYYDKTSLQEAKAVLRNAEIPFESDSPDDHLTSAYGQGTSHATVLKIREIDFEKAEELFETDTQESQEAFVSLDDYTIEELKDMAFNPQDWHPSFVFEAQKRLKSKGISLTPETRANYKTLKEKELEKGKEPKLVLFYTMWVLALLGGLVGIISGLSYWLGTVKDENGTRYHAYTKQYRFLGMMMFFSGIAVLTFMLLWYYNITHHRPLW